MAYQTRGRDPLLDSNMAEIIERRGKELIGLALVSLAIGLGAMLWSYSPDDPSWMSAVDAPVRNWLGAPGAKLSAALFMIVGWGAWGIVALLGIWGARYVSHIGQHRALSRVIFAPIWVAVLALYWSALPPGGYWGEAHSFGLGGLFGDTILGAMLGMLPMSVSAGLKLMALLLGAGSLILGAFVLGFDRGELKRMARFLIVGVIMTYSWILTLMGKGAGEAVRAARAGREMQAGRRARRIEAVALTSATPPGPRLQAEPGVTIVPPRMRRSAAMVYEEQAAAPMVEAEPAPDRGKQGGLLSRMPSLMRRAEPEPEPVMQMLDVPGADAPMGEDRIRAKIADVIKTRVRQNPALQAESAAPLTKGRGRGPDPLVLNTGVPRAPGGLPPEPPLTAATGLPPEPPLTAAAMQSHAIEEDYTADLVEDLPPMAEPTAPRIPMPEQRKVVQHPPRKTVQPSQRAVAEAQPRLQFEEPARVQYELPPLSLLSNAEGVEHHHLSDEALEENARMLESVLDDYGVKGDIVSVRPGPVVTMYELEPAPGLKASRVIGLADDIARSMSALSARVSTVPGRSVIGIELPNDHREMVVLREILATRDFGDGNQKLPLALGKDIGGDPIVANLAKMPHLLIAGTTGSGKSVAINTMILSLLYKLTPDECRLIMIDPKMLELSVYDGIPHLLSPVVTDPKKAVVALKWTVAEMEERYRKMSKMGVRNIDGYNSRVADAQAKGEMFSRTVQTGFDDETGEPVFETEEFAPEKMPYIVVIVDEMADLMMVAGKEIEACIQRLAQMARASGIHIIMATQRPSVDVITGTIKANFPTRISFQVTSKVDSRTILGEMGAEQLLGMGDMLYMAGGSKIVRCHGPFVSDEEVEEVVTNLKAYGPPDYVGGVVEGPDEEKADSIDAVLGLATGGNTDGEDALYDQAVQIVITDRKCSTSYIQRKLAIGYNKAARLVEQMEEQGLVSAANHVGKREILVPEQ